MEFYQSFNPSETSVPEKYDWISDQDYKDCKLGNSGSSSLKKGYGRTLEESIEVDVVRFDTWHTENNIGLIDLAWIDVQGAEKDVLDGMGETINKIKYIWIEYGETEYEDAMTRSETIELLTNKGYRIVESMSSQASAGDLMFRRVD